MKPENISQDNAATSKLLQEWKVTSPLPPRFNDQVWRRIERKDAGPAVEPWTVLRIWIARKFARPSMAAGYVTVLLLAGLLAGYWQARAGTERTARTLSLRYVQTVSSFQAH
jgi:hypothetical protein